MRCLHLLVLVALISSCRAWRPDPHDATIVSRGSGSRSPSPSSATGKGKAPTHEGHSTRLFGVDLQQKPEKAPAHSSGPSTRLFGVSMTPGKPSSPEHTSHSSETHTGHPDQKEHVTLRPHIGRHFAALYKPEDTHKRPAPGAAQQPAGPSVAKPHTGPQWWKYAGGRPRMRRPPGQSPRYETARRVREKKKLKMLAAHQASEHPSGHQPPKGEGPGSPGPGSNAVTKRHPKE